MSDNIHDTLKERGNTYGDYKGGTQLRANVMHLITSRYSKLNNKKLMPHHLEIMIFDIVNKISRLAVTPDHIDTWHDIQGYAKLSEELLIEEKANARKQSTT